ncbi:hypothetical protein [Archaeoglobus sp.]
MNSKVVILAVLLGVIVFALTTIPKPTAEKQKVNVDKKPKLVKKSKPRRFKIEIVRIEESGTLSRVITAKLINSDGYAKNVVVTLELFVDKDRIKVNGRDKLVIPIGDMEPNSSVEKKVEISVSFFDGLKIKSKGYVNAKLTISWDGGREVFKKRIKV